MIRRLAVLLLAAVAVSVPGPGAHATPPTDPTTLPRGAEPQLTWLGGRTIHAASGKETQVPVSAGHAAYLRLLGKSRGQWIVVDPAGHHQGARDPRRGHADVLEAHLSTSRRRPTRCPGAATRWSSGTPTGAAPPRRRSSDWTGASSRPGPGAPGGDILDFSADRLVLGFNRTQTWTVGAKPKPVAGRAAAVDVSRDVLFVADEDYRAGPTSLLTPGPARWYAAFTPRSISPDGTWVAGFNARMNRLQVRSMADGSQAPVTLKSADGRRAGLGA